MDQFTDLNEIFIFAKVVQCRSFIAASRQMGIPKTTVSRKVSELEARLGARLLHRTTRQLSLTEIGQVYFQHAVRIVDEIEEANISVDKLQAKPRGRLRITVPIDMPQIDNAIASFAQRFPDINIELHATSETIDLVQHQFDVGIRVGAIADSSFISRRLFNVSSCIVASPSYIKQNPAITRPEQLQSQSCLSLHEPSAIYRWNLVNKDKTAHIDIAPRCTSNNFRQLTCLALSGLGVAMIPEQLCRQLLNNKTLLRVLPEWASPELPVQIIYHSSQHLSPKIRALIDHLVAPLKNEPIDNS